MSHPLCGADLKTLSTVFADAGSVAPGKRLKKYGIWAAAIGRTPLSTLEKAIFTSSLPTVEDIAPPIFVLGHWRSGTTHLYNTMVKADTFSYVDPIATGLPWDILGMARILRPLLERTIPRDRYIDNIPVTADAPQEDEIALASMTPVSFYHAIYFPSKFHEHLNRGLFPDEWTEEERCSRENAFRHFMLKLSYRDKKQLLIKNPVYTGCPDFIRSVFPNAKFIHIHRNPFEVFLSMRNFYQKLLPVFALQPYEHLDIEDIVLQTYSKMMHRFEQETAGLKAPDFVEIGYEELSNNPLGSLEKIYSDLQLDGFSSAKPAFENYLGSVSGYRKNVFKGTPDMAQKVQIQCAHFIEKWAYQMPEIASP